MCGKVYLVGAGPGAADLLTLRGLTALRDADVIIQDALLPPDYLAALPLSTRTKKVLRLEDGEARRCGGGILQEIVEFARAGRNVARLKGGDPGIFGRLAEEIDMLRAAGLDVEIIPGPSVATSASTSAGTPLTVRGRGRSFAVTTARNLGGDTVEELPRADSLAIQMWVEAAPVIARKLLDQGWPRETPVRIHERASMEYERVWRCSLDDLPERVSSLGVRPPALLIVGAAAAVPTGRTLPVILYTGNRPANFRQHGQVLHWPALRERPVAGAPERSRLSSVLCPRGKPPSLVLTDGAAVQWLLESIRTQGLDSRCLSGVRIIALDATAARALEAAGIVPDARTMEELIRLVPGTPAGRARVLVLGTLSACSRVRRLTDAHRFDCRTIVTHVGECTDAWPDKLPQADALLFDAPEEVEPFWARYGSSSLPPAIWCAQQASLVVARGLGLQAVSLEERRFGPRRSTGSSTAPGLGAQERPHDDCSRAANAGIDGQCQSGTVPCASPALHAGIPVRDGHPAPLPLRQDGMRADI